MSECSKTIKVMKEELQELGIDPEEYKKLRLKKDLCKFFLEKTSPKKSPRTKATNAKSKNAKSKNAKPTKTQPKTKKIIKKETLNTSPIKKSIEKVKDDNKQLFNINEKFYYNKIRKNNKHWNFGNIFALGGNRYQIVSIDLSPIVIYDTIPSEITKYIENPLEFYLTKRPEQENIDPYSDKKFYPEFKVELDHKSNWVIDNYGKEVPENVFFIFQSLDMFPQVIIKKENGDFYDLSQKEVYFYHIPKNDEDIYDTESLTNKRNDYGNNFAFEYPNKKYFEHFKNKKRNFFSNIPSTYDISEYLKVDINNIKNISKIINNPSIFGLKYRIEFLDLYKSEGTSYKKFLDIKNLSNMLKKNNIGNMAIGDYQDNFVMELEFIGLESNKQEISEFISILYKNIEIEVRIKLLYDGLILYHPAVIEYQIETCDHDGYCSDSVCLYDCDILYQKINHPIILGDEEIHGKAKDNWKTYHILKKKNRMILKKYYLYMLPYPEINYGGSYYCRLSKESEIRNMDKHTFRILINGIYQLDF